MKLTKTISVDLLEHFKSNKEVWFNRPFNAFGKSMATDAFTLITVPEIRGYVDETSRISIIYPMDRNMDKNIEVSEIKSKLHDTTGRMVFGIKRGVFDTQRIQDLLYVADKLKTKKVTLISQNHKGVSMFLVGEAEVILMYSTLSSLIYPVDIIKINTINP